MLNKLIVSVEENRNDEPNLNEGELTISDNEHIQKEESHITHEMWNELRDTARYYYNLMVDMRGGVSPSKSHILKSLAQVLGYVILDDVEIDNIQYNNAVEAIEVFKKYSSLLDEYPVFAQEENNPSAQSGAFPDIYGDGGVTARDLVDRYEKRLKMSQ